MNFIKITRNPRKTVVRLGPLKVFWRNREFLAENLRNRPESDYPALLEKWYFLATGEKLDLRAPTTFRQKIQWLKLYGDRKMMTKLADKVAVRDFVAEKVGPQYLIDLLGVYERAADIDWDALPTRFVLKPNHGSHWVKVVEDKSALDIPAVCREADGWLKEDFSLCGGFEMQYRDILPRLMIERHLGELTHDLNDYKVWCFGGKPLYIQIMAGRQGDGGCTTAFYSTGWEKQSFWRGYPLCEDDTPRPARLDEMLSAAATLSAGLPFVRVDFYVLDDESLKFGEMTFTPASGEGAWYGEDGIDERLGALIALPSQKETPDVD